MAKKEKAPIIIKLQDVEIKTVLSKIADSQLMLAEAIKNINHNTTTVAECQLAIRDNIIGHSATTTQEHKNMTDIIERYWKLILVMLALIGGLVGVKLVFPTV